ncbi:MAG: DinB family protein [Flavobacteriaceae bacterium]|nr:DinB family protein [Flavobacteriaceae bacterium]
MISAIIQNLERGKKLVWNIEQHQYTDNGVAPYYSSIGIHMRHVLDIFDCIFDGLPAKSIDLTQRRRNEVIEQERLLGLRYFELIIGKLQELDSENLDIDIEVSDDLGKGKVKAKYTLAAVLIQAHSHAIHHFASIGYIIHQLGISLPDEDFGYNPTTPKTIKY